MLFVAVVIMFSSLKFKKPYHVQVDLVIFTFLRQYIVWIEKHCILQKFFFLSS